MRVEEIMARNLVTVRRSTTLKEAAPLILEHKISSVPVVEDGCLIGVLSESDIVAKETSGYSNGEVEPAEALHLQREREAATVSEAMTRDVVTIEPWVSIWAAADVMVVHDVNRLPVVDPHGMLVGLVTRTDLVRAFARSDRDIERDIREHLLPSVGLSPEAVKIGVRDGIVTVEGEVEQEIARECLRASVHLVPGVVEVAWHVEPAELTV
jgi:CBS domain-containing protein